MMKHAVSSPDAPAAIGPYSPAVRAGQLLFISGQIPIDAATGQMIEGDEQNPPPASPRLIVP